MTIRATISRLLAIGRRREIDAELAEEIATHLEIAADAKRMAGMAAAEARAAARRDFGNPTLARETSRQWWGWPTMEALISDLKFGARMLRKYRMASAVAIGALGIGIGATVGVVSVLHAVTYPAYPYEDPDRLAVAWARRARPPLYDEMQVSLAETRFWREKATQSSLAGFSWARSVNVSAGASPVRTQAVFVTGNFMTVLGVAPEMGRTFTMLDENDDGGNIVVVTYDFWKETLGGDPSALSKPLIIDRVPYAVVGIMRPGFHVPILLSAKLMLPVRRTSWVMDHSARSILPIARLAPNASWTSASRELNQLTTSFHSDDPVERDAWQANVQSFAQMVTLQHREHLLRLFLALAGIVLLIASANVAILLLARIPARRQELAVRLALGAHRGRIVVQLLAESALLILGAAMLGTALARPVMSMLLHFMQPSLLFDVSLDMNGPAVVGALALAAATCLICGIAPAIAAVRSVQNAGTLIGVRTTGARDHERLRSLLVAAEVALAVVLVAAGSLMAESLVAIGRRSLGFEPREIVSARVLLDTARYTSPAARESFYGALAERLSARPEVRDVVIASTIPLATAGELANYVTRQPMSPADKPDTISASSGAIFPDYFRALHVPIVEGKMFDGREREPVVAVNEELARRLWPGRSAVGKYLRVLAPMFNDGEAVASGERRIVAVVRNMRPSPTYPTDAWPYLWVPYAQQPLRAMYVAVRSSTPASATSAIRTEVNALDPLLPVFGVKTIDELRDYWFADARLNTLIADVLAGVGLLLTLVGIYSVVAVFVSQRTREIGIRIAVGARTRDVMRLVLGRTLIPAALGVSVGAAASLASARVLGSMLYGVSPFDPRALGAACVVLLCVVVAAALLPARRASRLDPLIALRLD